MHRVQGEDTSFDQLRRQKRLERIDLVLFLSDIAMPQDNPSLHFVANELMDRL